MYKGGKKESDLLKELGVARAEGKMTRQQEMESFVYYGMGSHLLNSNRQIFIEHFLVPVFNVLCIHACSSMHFTHISSSNLCINPMM